MLSDVIRDEFDDLIYQRGVQYQAQRRVTIKQSDSPPRASGEIRAVVKGSDDYGVVITWDHRGFDFECQCPYFEEHGNCKHIVATLLEASARNALPAWFRDKSPAPRAGAFTAAKPKKPAEPPKWETLLRGIGYDNSLSADTESASPLKQGTQLIYVLHPGYGDDSGPDLEVLRRVMKADGAMETKALNLRMTQLMALEASDRDILAMLGGLDSRGFEYSTKLDGKYKVHSAVAQHVLPILSRTGRLFWRENQYGTSAKIPRVIWVDEPFDVKLGLAPVNEKELELQCLIGQGGELQDCLASKARCFGPVVIMGGFIGMLREGDTAKLLRHFRNMKEPVRCPKDRVWEFLTFLGTKPDLPELAIPESLGIHQIVAQPQVRVRLEKEQAYFGEANKLVSIITFSYENGGTFGFDDNASWTTLKDTNTLVRRNRAAEREAMDFMLGIGFKIPSYSYDNYGPRILITKALPAILAMVGRGWHVEAEDVGRYRTAAKFEINVSSGIDWFDLEGGADFDGKHVSLPTLLEAIRKGERFVKLGDGSIGVIPEKWLKHLGVLAGSGERNDDAMRFTRNQATLLDLLLQQLPDAKWDERFEEFRKELASFDGIRPAHAPADFVGELRDYQREGLGWFAFLDRFGWGGCLADDMGLGKTIQVLALFEQRRAAREADPGKPKMPSLVVAPRSLIFNWMEEARRFTPKLRLLDHTGSDRAEDAQQLAEHDVVLTTYGTLRSDVTFLSQIAFEYVVLDESQFIKNSSTATAKCVRLLKGNRRLALSGTPIENHLRELWSLFEFLNPGMLGSAGAFRNIAGAKELNGDTAQLLGRALRPFILRRTKQQVAKELPERTESTIHCELDKAGQKEYDQLKEHYRQSLLGKIDSEGIERSQMQVLEALLRLRQAACHPGLLDPARTDESSAKLESIVEQVREVTEEGHKALVFSQFTSFLSIVRKRLDVAGISYEYLDGQIRDRQERVMRFQNDPDCKLFLISLKAGGVGLNLTAAEYVFLLDPWWNPAVEAQAIDRAHRIGQMRQVFAYRLITKGTVEEKVLELQRRKRDLADAIISASAGPLSSLTREDLDLLLT